MYLHPTLSPEINEKCGGGFDSVLIGVKSVVRRNLPDFFATGKHKQKCLGFAGMITPRER